MIIRKITKPPGEILKIVKNVKLFFYIVYIGKKTLTKKI